VWAQAPAQTPKRGGTLSLRTWDPPHFDHILAHAYKTHVVISFTHSRLLKHKAGPGVRPGSFPIEGDLAESWQQVNDTTYVFKLKKGVRFHAKPPVNGRELTAEDVRYTYERILTDKGSVNVSMYRAIAKVEAVDKYTVRFTLKEPFAWFLDMVANPMAGAIIAKECVEKFGDLKKPEAVIGTGPVDARRLQAERLDHPGAQSHLLRRRPAVYRPGGDVRRRGQCLPHRGVPRRQVRPRLGVPGHDPTDGLGADRRGAQEAPPQSEDPGIPLQRDEHHRHEDGQAAVQRRPRAAGHLAGDG
jgi:ABC-type transport system substrate-binding protein